VLLRAQAATAAWKACTRTSRPVRRAFGATTKALLPQSGAFLVLYLCSTRLRWDCHGLCLGLQRATPKHSRFLTG